MSEEKKNPYSQGLWQDSKDEPGIVAISIAAGGLAGATVGFGVSQLAGTPIVPSMLIGTAGGVALGTVGGVYVAHRVGEAKAEAFYHVDLRIREAGLPAPTKEQEIATLIGGTLAQPMSDAITTSMKSVVPEIAKLITAAQNAPEGSN